jgi:hypothetical protein
VSENDLFFIRTFAKQKNVLVATTIWALDILFQHRSFLKTFECSAMHNIPIYNILLHPIGYRENRLNRLETISVSSIMTRDVKTEKEDQNVLTACRTIDGYTQSRFDLKYPY